MSNHENRWPAVGTAIQARVETLHVTLAELQRETGISFKTLKRYMAGEPIKRADKARWLTGALGWSDDSIDLILAGRKPKLTGNGAWDDDDAPASAPTLVSRLATVEGIAAAGVPALTDLQDGFAALRERIEQVEARVKQVEAEVRVLKRRPRPPRASDG